ncbi:amidohydrolase [Virgibacillus halodenitrificans]|nr:amidohydrolase [Virgibacillus halodenitrificans]
MDINPTQFSEVMEEVIAWRRLLHMNPELSYQEINTSQFIYNTLLSFGSLKLSRPTKTSVVATLKGEKPGKVLALRADIDALPITEKADVPFRSRKEGVMHACGHDAHAAMLLGAAKLLSERRDQLHGEIRFVFQHAEEVFPGGAKEMVNAGVMEGVDQIVGLHVFTMVPTGKIFVRPGFFTANSDTFEAKIIGYGGHSSEPEATIDPVSIGAQVITNLQHIIARKIDPAERAVISVTEINAGSAKNVIPSSLYFGGSVRSFSQEVRMELAKQIEQVIKGVTTAHQASYEYDYQVGYGSVYNDPEIESKIETLIEEKFQPNVIYNEKPFMGGEDFSAFLEEVPGCFIGIGAAYADEEKNYPHHHAKFNINEEVLETGVRLLIQLPFYLQKG